MEVDKTMAARPKQVQEQPAEQQAACQRRRMDFEPLVGARYIAVALAHGYSLSAYSPSGLSPSSCTLIPSSRSFCWKLCRYIPARSAAREILPPVALRAPTKKSRSHCARNFSF